MSAQWFALTWINPHPAKLISHSVLGSPPAKRACLSVLRPPPHWQVFMPPLTPTLAHRCRTAGVHHQSQSERNSSSAGYRILRGKQLSQAARKAGLRAAPLAGIDGATPVHFSLGFSDGF